METDRKNRLLIVDDEKSNLKILTNILSPEYSIITATSGKNAIEKAKEYKPDLILLDILMPEMDGYQTLCKIKNCEELHKIPVIFITGLDSDINEEKGLSLDAADYITKPFHDSIVILRVRHQINYINAVAAAESANRSKSLFLSRLSHEIRTPLNGILGISAIQLQNENHPQEIKNAFTRIFNSGDLLLGIVNDILDMSKIESGKFELVQAQYNFENMIKDTVFLNLIKFENKPVEFILNIDENMPSALIGDEIRIKQILNNLLSNAFKYTASGEVELSAFTEVSHNNLNGNVTLVIKIRDTGEGMTEEQVDKLFHYHSHNKHTPKNEIETNMDDPGVFEPQVQEFKDTSGESEEAKHPGTGLGMSIVRYLLQMMNGVIHVKSEPGKGSVFTIRLPQINAGAGTIGKETALKLHEFHSDNQEKTRVTRIVRENINPGKVLIVDDIDINLYVAKEMLSPYGLDVDLAASGAQAIELIKKVKYDLVFMDHIMPIMDGIETAKEIRKMGYAKLPIIALTANAVPGVKKMFLDNGFNGFISKPIGLHELDAVLKQWMLPGA
ncbi:MAG: response regulator [Treponema sp.]|nr:response regulator [Treponema sp.]